MYGAASAHRRTLRRRKVDTSARAGAGAPPEPAPAAAAAAAAGSPLASRRADEYAGAREPRAHAAAARKLTAAQLHSMANREYRRR